nr:MAG TPA: hypothetical protein [Caudoviricetes sp.]
MLRHNHMVLTIVKFRFTPIPKSCVIKVYIS